LAVVGASLGPVCEKVPPSAVLTTTCRTTSLTPTCSSKIELARETHSAAASSAPALPPCFVTKPKSRIRPIDSSYSAVLGQPARRLNGGAGEFM